MAKRVARSIVYVDGFNFYYGAIRGGPHRWLNIEKYFQRLRHDDDLRRIYYFTALMSGPKRQRQAIYLRALETLPLVDVIPGRFKDKTVSCRVSSCSFAGDRRFAVPEEKRTDVAIGVQMVVDAYEDNCDRFILVSADSDLLPAVAAVKRVSPKKEIIVYIPTRNRVRGAATELRGVSDKDRNLPLELLRHCQFPASLPDGAGGHIQKPTGW